MVLFVLFPFALIFLLVCFIVCEMVSLAFSNREKARIILRSITGLMIVAFLFDFGFFGSFYPPRTQTVDTLLEQASGDKIYWERKGVRATGWKCLTYRRYDKSCQEYAIKQLGELGADASEAVPELIRIFNEQDDFDSGDGVYNCRSAVARTLGKIGQPEAIAPMIEMLRTKSLSPDEPYTSGIYWHDKEYEDNRSYLKEGRGPQAIMMGLMLMNQKHHRRIAEELLAVRDEIEDSDLFNDWSKREIDLAICYFNAPSKLRIQISDDLSKEYCRSIDSIDPQLLSALASHSDLTDARK